MTNTTTLKTVASGAAAALAILAATGPAAAQGDQPAVERGGFAILRGADTLVVERFVRASAALQGELTFRGAPKVGYYMTVAPGEMVQSLTLSVYAPGAATDAPPVQVVPMAFRGDTVVARAPQGVQRIPTRYGAIPLLNNSIAMTELFARRARGMGGAGEIPLFATAGGSTIGVKVTPIGADSLVMDIGPQQHRFAVDALGRVLGGEIPSAHLRIVRLGADAAKDLVLAPPADVEPPKPDYSAPPGAPYTAAEVTVAGPGGITLGGTLTMPKGAGPFPAVVTITGSGQQDRDEFIPLAGGVRLFRQLADTLSRRGIAVLRLDDRGLGASGGDPATSTSADFADDTRAAVAYLRARKDIDGARIGLVGHSEGGLIAPMVAATDARIRAIVVMAGPASRGIEISKAQNRYMIERMSVSPAQKDSLYALAVKQLDAMDGALPWTRFWLAYDPAPAARRVKAATLIVQGETDRQVPAGEAGKLAGLIRSGGNMDVTVRMLPSVNHLFLADSDGDFAGYDKLPSPLVAPSVLGVVADWLAAKLGAAAPRPQDRTRPPRPSLPRRTIWSDARARP